MKDEQVSLPRIMLLHPLVRQEVIDCIDESESLLPKNCKIRVVQGLRTKEEQDALYAQGRTTEGKIVTNAKFGQSFHCFGLAIDFALMYDLDGNGTYETLSWDTEKDLDKDGIKDWQEVVVSFKSKGWAWGGDFKSIQDDPHLEKTFGYGWRDLLNLYKKESFIVGTKYVLL